MHLLVHPALALMGLTFLVGLVSLLSKLALTMVSIMFVPMPVVALPLLNAITILSDWSC